MSEFVELFNPGIFDDERSTAAMREQLGRGRAIVIPDAVRPDVAERAHAELDASKRWRPYEGAFPFFHYRHHNLFSDEELPPTALEVKRVLDSATAKQAIADLSQRDCGGVLDFGASLYLPGDHSLPHQDLGLGRSVAFVWHLTKRWEPSWGGGLFWCPSGMTLAPRFNCLTMFVVSPASAHFVTVVSSYAREKRLSINGWWTTSALAERTRFEKDDAPSDGGIFSAGYGAPLERLVGGANIIAI